MAQYFVWLVLVVLYTEYYKFQEMVYYDAIYTTANAFMKKTKTNR